MIVNELVTKFKFDVGNGFKNFEKQLQNEARHVDRTTKRMGRLFKALGRDIGDSVRARMKIAGAKAAHRDLKRIKRIAVGIKGTLKSLVLPGGLVGALGAIGAGALAKDIFDTNVEFAKLKGAMKTAIGPAGNFSNEYQRIKDFASTTPFDLKQSMKAFVKLKNLGLNPSNKALKSYGNTAAAMGKDMNQMIEAVADASTMEFERLKEFGIKARQQGDEVEFTFQGVKTKVKKDSKEIEKYLLNIGETKFGDAMADQMKGLPGLVSNIADNFDLLKLALFEKGGLEKAIVPVLAKVRDALKNLEPFVISVGKKLSNFVRDMQVFAKLKIVPALEKAGGAFDMIKSAAKPAAFFLGLFLANSVGVRAIYASKALVKGLQLAAFWLRSVGLSGFIAAAGAAATQIAIGGLLFAIGAVAIAQGEFAETGDSFLIRLADKWFGLGWAVENLHVSIEAIKMGLADLASADGWVKILTFNFEMIKTFGTLAWNMLRQAWHNAVEEMKAIAEGMKQRFINTWNLIKETAIEAGNNISSSVGGAIENIISWLEGLGPKAVKAFGDVVKAALDAARRMPVLGSVVRGAQAVGNALTMNTGGMVPGGFGTRDTVPAMLTPGEVVVPVNAVKQIQAGNPAGFAKVAQLAQTKMTGTSQQQSYSMPASTVARGAGSTYAANINAPITQNYQISMGEGTSPTAVARAVTTKSAGSIRQELDFVARQAPRRVARA